MKKNIQTEKAPKAVGPYSQAVEHGNTLYVSGQLPIDPSTGSMAAEDIQGQALQVMENLKAIIIHAGYTMEQVVKCTCLLVDLNDFKRFNEVYGAHFPTNPPARVTFQVAALPLGALVEVDAVVCR
jgi:2-iminobutanoate/2-iminopropanoate deaminase